MSLSVGNEGRAALVAFDACDRMLAQLREALAHHEYARAQATPDWEGPHRDTFDDRFEQVQYEFRLGEAFVLHVQALARTALAVAYEELREANAYASRVPVRW